MPVIFFKIALYKFQLENSGVVQKSLYALFDLYFQAKYFILVTLSVLCDLFRLKIYQCNFKKI